jgi:hypothetical protein
MVDDQKISFAVGAPDGWNNEVPSAWWITVARQGNTVTLTVQSGNNKGGVLVAQTVNV